MQLHKHYIAQLDRLVTSLVEHWKRCLVGQWTHFMKDWRTTLPEEQFQLVHVTRGWYVEEAKTKCLRTRRTRAVIHRVDSSDFDPLRSGIGNQPGASLNKA